MKLRSRYPPNTNMNRGNRSSMMENTGSREGNIVPSLGNKFGNFVLPLPTTSELPFRRLRENINALTERIEVARREAWRGLSARGSVAAARTGRIGHFEVKTRCLLQCIADV